MTDKVNDSAISKGRLSYVAWGALAGGALGAAILLYIAVLVGWYLTKIDSSLSVLVGILTGLLILVGGFPLSFLAAAWRPALAFFAVPANLAMWGALLGLMAHRKDRLANRLNRTFSLSPTDQKGQLKGFAYLWAGAPLIAGLAGGIMGWFYGAAATWINLKIMVSPRSTKHKCAATALVFGITSALYFATVLLYLSHFHA